MKLFRLGAAPRNGVGFGTTDLEYIQDGISEAVTAIVSAQLPEGYNLPVIMNGCVVTKVGTNYTHTAGQIYYQGFIYTVDALTTALASPAGFAKWAILEVPAADNPVVFDNGSSYNIDIHLKFRLVASTETGIVQYDEIRRLEHIQFNKSKELYTVAEMLMKLPSVDFLSDFFDSNGLGIPYKKYEGFALMNGLASFGGYTSPDMGGIGFVGTNHTNAAFADVRGAGDYIVSLVSSLVGKWKTLINATELPEGTFTGNGALPAPSRVFQSPVVGTDYGFFGAQSAMDIRQPIRSCIMIQKIAEISA